MRDYRQWRKYKARKTVRAMQLPDGDWWVWLGVGDEPLRMSAAEFDANYEMAAQHARVVDFRKGTIIYE